MEQGINLEPDTDTPLGNVCGSENINQYICAVCNLLGAQRRHGVTTITREYLMSDHMKGLIKITSGRAERVMKENFKERCDRQFQPFRIIDYIPEFEEEFWNNMNMTKVYETVAL